VVPIQWAVINTAAIVAMGGYLWRQSRKVDVLYQAFFGVDGRNGILRRLDEVLADAKSVDARIADTRHTMRNEMQTAIMQLHDELDRRIDRELRKP